VELTLRLIKHHVMKVYGRMEVQLLTSLNSGQYECEWSAARPTLFNSWGKSPQVTSWISGKRFLLFKASEAHRLTQ